MKSFKISCWNIQGLHSSTFGNKTIDLLSNIKDIDIAIFHETWCRSNETLHCPKGIREIIIPSQKKSQIKCGRNLKHLIKTVKTQLEVLEVKSILPQNNLYLCAAYIPPHDSPYYQEKCFLHLQKDILYFQSQGNVLICGDLNARTGREMDYINTTGNGHIFGDIICQSTVITQRNSCDNIINKNGKQLLKLCKGLGLYILNGRTRGDTFGKFTYCSKLGASVVDYSLTDIEPNFINAFTVRPQLPVSDHCQTVLYLKQSYDRVKISHKHENCSP